MGSQWPPQSESDDWLKVVGWWWWKFKILSLFFTKNWEFSNPFLPLKWDYEKGRLKFKEMHEVFGGFPCSSISKVPACRRPGFDPWVRKIPWRRTWQHTLVFLPIEFHGQGSLAGYSPWGRKECVSTEQPTLSLHFFPWLQRQHSTCNSRVLV